MNTQDIATFIRRNLRPASIVWCVPFVALAIALANLVGAGTVVMGEDTFALIQLLCVLGVALSLLREPLLRPLDRLADSESHIKMVAGRVLPLLRDWALLAFVVAATCTALEVPWNTSLADVDAGLLALERGCVTAVVVCAWLVGQRRGWLVAVCAAGLSALGIAQGFLLTLKGTAILPSDLLALGTAAAVADGFTYEVTPLIAQGILLLVASLDACVLMRPAGRPIGRVWGRAAVTALVALVACVCAANGYNALDLHNDYEIQIDYWWPSNSYYQYGMLPTFTTMAKDMEISVPKGYTDEEAAGTEAALAQDYDSATDPNAAQARADQFGTTHPSVVFVMNETFADLSSIYGDLGVGYEGPTYFKSIDDALVRGNLTVSAYGGGTCNSEFETLTGSSLSYIGMGLYPYTLYDFDDTPNLARQFAEMGYDTTAIHPNLSTNWNRESVYEQMGFDRFYDISAFEDAPVFHSGVTDAATYQKVLDQLASSDTPQFVLDVTMQNHSSYNQYNIPEDRLTTYNAPYWDQAGNDQLNEYLSCIQASDQDLQWFIEQLRGLDRPVMLVFFGDHQPNFGMALDDALYGDAGQTAHSARAYQTNYLVWANYDVAATGKMRCEQTSTSTLGALALDAIGAPLTSYQKAALGARLSMPGINLFAYQDGEGFWHTTSGNSTDEPAQNAEAEYAAERALEAWRQLAHVQYLEFAKTVQ